MRLAASIFRMSLISFLTSNNPFRHSGISLGEYFVDFPLRDTIKSRIASNELQLVPNCPSKSTFVVKDIKIQSLLITCGFKTLAPKSQ